MRGQTRKSLARLQQYRAGFRRQIQHPRQLVNLVCFERRPFDPQPSHRWHRIGPQLEAHADRRSSRGRLGLRGGSQMLDSLGGIGKRGFDRSAIANV